MERLASETWNTLDFLIEEEIEVKSAWQKPYKIIIADDDDQVHTITRVMLQDFTFEGRDIELIHTYTASETKLVLLSNTDIAVLLLDVVMEGANSGFQVVEYLRNDLLNNITRIILRTGQPGDLPENVIFRKYDINDYSTKTDVTVDRLNNSLLNALRNYMLNSTLKSPQTAC